MPLSNAERQQRWREKQKLKNKDAFMMKERMRKRAAYISVDGLTEKELKKRRESGRKREQMSYYRRKERQNKNVENVTEVTGIETRSRQKNRNTSGRDTKRIIVKLPAIKRRYRCSLQKAYREIGRLKNENKRLKKNKRKIQKRYERLASNQKDKENSYLADVSSETNTPEANSEITLTPRSRSNTEMRGVGLSPRKYKRIKRKLVMANVVIDSMTPTIKQKKRKSDLHNKTIKFHYLQKYKCVNYLSQRFGVSRRKLRYIEKTRAGKSLKDRLQAQVTSFLQREDNSTTLPGKKDVKDNNQKMVLTDYMHNLHQKFKIENPSINISRAAFCKMRPQHVLLACFSSRKTCLCSLHQNMALKLKGMRDQGMQCSQNPDVFIKQFEDSDNLKEVMTKTLGENVCFKEWKKVKDGDKYRWKEVSEVLEKEEFMTLMAKDTAAFKSHVERVQTQYREIRKLRENLPEGEILLWMDFAENYTCSSIEEIQSAYWNASMVSLHTMVAYFPDSSGKSLQSYVAVSDVLSHNATSVYTILHKVIPKIKEDYPGLLKIHYLTDSPTSQYRNKTIFKILGDHEKVFKVKAQWNYLESGHGKGPCDGLGASVKRSADMAVKQGKVSIQNGKEFFLWANETSKQGSKIKYLHYDQTEYDNSKSKLDRMVASCQAIGGTFRIHAVIPLDDSRILVRETSCYCDSCLGNTSDKCTGWVCKFLCKETKGISKESGEQGEGEKEQELELENNVNAPENIINYIPQLGSFVAAVYSNRWYIGQISEIDDDEGEALVNFMTKSGKYCDAYKWPSNKDEIWIPYNKVLLEVGEPVPAGKSSRSYRFNKLIVEAVQDKFKSFN